MITAINATLRRDGWYITTTAGDVGPLTNLYEVGGAITMLEGRSISVALCRENGEDDVMTKTTTTPPPKTTRRSRRSTEATIAEPVAPTMRQLIEGGRISAISARDAAAGNRIDVSEDVMDDAERGLIEMQRRADEERDAALAARAAAPVEYRLIRALGGARLFLYGNAADKPDLLAPLYAVAAELAMWGYVPVVHGNSLTVSVELSDADETPEGSAADVLARAWAGMSNAPLARFT